MKRRYTNSYIISAMCILLLLSSCGSKAKPQDNRYVPARKPAKEAIADVNRYLSEKDRAVIEGYGRRNKLELTLSESGFYYHIFDEGEGMPISQNSVVAITGTLSLIDGTLCYTYGEKDPKEVAIARSPEITGLHIALPMLKENGRAIFIFPPSLAFGLPGDGDKIPPRSTIIMNISVLNVEQK